MALILGQSTGIPGTVRARPLSFGPRVRRKGAAAAAHASASGYSAAAAGPKQERSMSVLMTPGLRAMAARPGGSSWARARVSPSMAHLLAQ